MQAPTTFKQPRFLKNLKKKQAKLISDLTRYIQNEKLAMRYSAFWVLSPPNRMCILHPKHFMPVCAGCVSEAHSRAWLSGSRMGQCRPTQLTGDSVTSTLNPVLLSVQIFSGALSSALLPLCGEVWGNLEVFVAADRRGEVRFVLSVRLQRWGCPHLS